MKLDLRSGPGRDSDGETGVVSPDTALADVERSPHRPLLEELARQAMDSGYAAAARRRASAAVAGRPPAARGRRAVSYLSVAIALMILGAVLGMTIRSQRAAVGPAETARAGLVADVTRAQQRQSELEHAAVDLASRVQQRQQALGAGAEVDDLHQLREATATVPVSGPGITITIDRAGSTNPILDRDVQLLVNGLWVAGAEAVSVGGIRLRGASAIRQAGGAILVDNKPTFWPLEVAAIGDPATLTARFAETDGFGRFSSFQMNYGLRFDLKQSEQLVMAAAPASELRYARTLGPATTSATTAGTVNPTSEVEPTR